VVLIDGDGAIFHPSFIEEGRRGGREAAARLTKEIKAHLEPHQFKLHVHVFHNRRGLMTTLKRHGYNEAAALFDDFVVGFNQAAERFAIIDAGELKEGSDHKIRACLDDNIYSTETLQVFFGGCHDNGYVTTLNSYITSGHKDKLILLPGYTDIAVGIKKLGLPSLKIPGLFLPEKLAQPPVQHTIDVTRTPSPPTSPPGTVHLSSLVNHMVGGYKSAAQNQAFAGSDDGYSRWPDDGYHTWHDDDYNAFPDEVHNWWSDVGYTNYTRSPIRPSAGSSYLDDFSGAIAGANGRGLRKINPNLPISKQIPPPCTLFYLASCGHKSECRYAHDYDLSEDDMKTLRKNAKNNPCSAILKGDECSWGPGCIYGHVCPNGPRCYYGARCRFYGKGMHSMG